MTLVIGAPGITEQKEWVFRYYATVETQVAPIISLLKKLKVENLGVLYLNDPFGIASFEPVKEEFEKTGGIVKAQGHDATETDFKGQVTELEDSSAIYVVGYGSHLGNAIKRLREENFPGLILAGDGTSHYPVRSVPEAEWGVCGCEHHL